MKSRNFLVVAFIAMLFFGTYADDAAVINGILAANKKTDWNVNECAKFVEGRIIELNLTNKSPELDGIKDLGQEIGQLTELKVIVLNDNNLTAFPVQLYNCTKLERIEAQNNNLTDITAGISKLDHLKELDLRSNQIKNLPAELFHVRSLEVLKLWSNQLESISADIADLSSLKELYLKGNKLTTLPMSITRTKIKYIDVIDNNICEPPAAVDAWLKKFDDKYKSLQRCLGDKRLK